MITTEFGFEHRGGRLAPSAEPLLGSLADFLAGQPHEAIWKGKGFNQIWRPNHGQSGTKDFFLQLMNTTETLRFTDITGSGIANRGLLQTDIFLGGLDYRQVIYDAFDNTGQHFEPGVWLHIPMTTAPTEAGMVVRMGSIPHGADTGKLQGVAISVPAPQFDPIDITPFTNGSDPPNKVGFPEQDLSQVSASRTDLARVAGLDQAHLDNLNLFLSDAIAGQSILSTTVLSVSSPAFGGEPGNIPFLLGDRGRNDPNAQVANVTATFWIERVQGTDGQNFYQLQYTQKVLLNFAGLSWPHVTVATLIAQH